MEEGQNWERAILPGYLREPKNSAYNVHRPVAGKILEQEPTENL